MLCLLPANFTMLNRLLALSLCFSLLLPTSALAAGQSVRTRQGVRHLVSGSSLISTTSGGGGAEALDDAGRLKGLSQRDNHSSASEAKRVEPRARVAVSSAPLLLTRKVAGQRRVMSRARQSAEAGQGIMAAGHDTKANPVTRSEHGGRVGAEAAFRPASDAGAVETAVGALRRDSVEEFVRPNRLKEATLKLGATGVGSAGQPADESGRLADADEANKQDSLPAAGFATEALPLLGNEADREGTEPTKGSATTSRAPLNNAPNDTPEGQDRGLAADSVKAGVLSGMAAETSGAVASMTAMAPSPQCRRPARGQPRRVKLLDSGNLMRTAERWRQTLRVRVITEPSRGRSGARVR